MVVSSLNKDKGMTFLIALVLHVNHIGTTMIFLSYAVCKNVDNAVVCFSPLVFLNLKLSTDFYSFVHSIHTQSV